MIHPSQNFDEPWIYSRCATARPHTKEGGKWLIFRPTHLIDEAWLQVAAATENGLLGHASKASTAFGSKGSHVICVYTYDWRDEADAMRVRDMLHRLGFVEKLAYKTDADTLAGHYAGEGKRVSKYFR